MCTPPSASPPAPVTATSSKENSRARLFYEKAGFTPDGAEEPFEAGGVDVPEVRYARSLTRAG